MTTVEYIRDEIKKLYKNSPNIHVRIKSSRSSISSTPAIITGVYSNVFCLRETERKPCRIQTYQYADVLIGRVEIQELDYFPATNTKK